MATDPVLAARSALGHAVKTGDVEAIREARAALSLAKAERVLTEVNTPLASAADEPPTVCCPKCRDNGKCGQ